MSGEFILTKLREEFSKRCLIVRGIPPGTDHQSVNSIFKGQCQRIQHKAGSMWVILFHNPQQASNFIDIFPQQISQSTVFDIPDNWLQDQDDQRSSTAAMHSRNFLQGYQDNTIIFPPLNFQGQCPQNSKKNPFFHGHSKHPSAGTPSKIPVSDGPQMVPSDQNFYKSSLEPTFYMNYPNAPMSGPQVVPFDHKSNTSSFQPTIYENFPSFSMTRPHVEPYNSTSYKSSFESTVKENFPSMLMSGPVSSVPPPYENYDFAPPVPPRIPIRKSPAFQSKATKSAVQSSSIESVYKSSDDAELMRQTGEDFPLEAKLGGRSSGEESINKGSDFVPIDQIVQDFPLEAKLGGRSSGEESINKGSDFVPIDQIVQETTSEATCSIEVSSLPPNITEEFITFFFENSKRCGGGDVENVYYDEKNNTAIITFQDPAVVRNVLKKHETTALSMNKMQLQIKEYYPKTDDSEDDMDVTAVKVTNLPPKISKEQIELFFENIRRSGSEEFKKVDYDEAANCAIVWFNDSKVITNVLEKHKTSPFTFNKQKVEVEEYRPAAVKVERDSEEEEEGGGAIKVKRIYPETTEEEIKDFFENQKKGVEEALQQAFKGKVKIFTKNISHAGETAQNRQGDLVKGHVHSQYVEFETGHISVQLIKGQIARSEVDVIVNTASKDLNLDLGPVLASISKTGGDSIQQECRAKYPTGINFGEIAVTGGGNLACKIVCHVALPLWDKGGRDSKKCFTNILNSCLQESHTQNLSSIAFPAVGTGDLGYPRDMVAEEMCNSILNFSKENTNTSLKKVLFVVHERDTQTIEAFETEIQKQAIKPQHKRGRKRHGTPSKAKEDGDFVIIPNDFTTGVSQKEVAVDIGNVKLRMYKGDITDADVPAIVNCVGIETDLGGSKFAYKTSRDYGFGNQEKLQDGCAKITSFNECLKPSKCIIHIGVNEKNYKRTIEDLLNIVKDVKWNSIALPAIRPEFAEQVFSALSELHSDVKHLSEVHVVFYDEQWAQKFIMAIQQCVEDKTQTKGSVIEKIADTFEPQAEWSTMKDSDNLAMIPVNSGSPEYSTVIDRFQAQVGKREIVKLERIQNKMLYQQYVAKKKLIESQNPKGTKNERELWHGTAPHAVSSINFLGFNRSYCAKIATENGEGVDFAVDAGCSASDTYSKPDSQGHKRMYLCKVLTGEYTEGQSGMRLPPAKPGHRPYILYDSVVNDVSKPMYFTVFNDTRCYPAYLITFK